MSTITAPTPTYRLTSRGVLASEWTKFWSLRSSWITTAVSAVLLIAIGGIAAASYTPGEGIGPGDGSATGAVDLALAGADFASLAVGVLGVLIAAGEYSTGMIRSTLAAVPTRLPVLWSKSVLVGGLSFVVMTVAALASFLIGSPLVDDAMRMGLGDEGVLRSLVFAGFYLGLIGVFGVALGALVRSSAGGITTLAGLLLIVPGLTMLLPDSWADAVTPYLPSNGGTAMMALHTTDGQFTPWQGLAVVAVWVAVTLGAAGWRLKRADA
jgi:ABC-2 type transport system permease protein